MILNKKVIDDKIKFINEYKNAINPAEGSAVDSNANVTQKTIASLEAELYKDFSIQLNREMMVRRLKLQITTKNAISIILKSASKLVRIQM